MPSKSLGLAQWQDLHYIHYVELYGLMAYDFYFKNK